MMDSSSSAPDASDPSNFVTSPPSTHVKIINTARADLNDQIGIVVSYNAERGRYNVSLVPGQRPPNGARPGQAAADAAAARAAGGAGASAYMSFKPENLVRASKIEQLKVQFAVAKFNAMRTINDPQVREQFRRVYTSIDQRLPPQIKPEYAAIAALLVWVVLASMIGLSRAILITSLLSLFPVIAMEDIMAGADVNTMARNFPRRWREAIVRSTGFERLTEKQALIALGVLVALSLKLVLTPAPTAASVAASAAARGGGPGPGAGVGLGDDLGDVVGDDDAGPSVPPRPTTSKAALDLEEMYKLGYDDAKEGREYGTSLPQLNTAAEASAEAAPRGLADNLDFPYNPPPPREQSKFGFGTMMAAFTLFRFGKELAITPEGRFDQQFLMANVRAQPPWKFAIVAFCLYQVVKVLF